MIVFFTQVYTTVERPFNAFSSSLLQGPLKCAEMRMVIIIWPGIFRMVWPENEWAKLTQTSG